MRYKSNDILCWDGGDGILKNGQEYLVWLTREGVRRQENGERIQEFTLKHKDQQIVEPVLWFESGHPFKQMNNLGAAE